MSRQQSKATKRYTYNICYVLSYLFVYDKKKTKKNSLMSTSAIRVRVYPFSGGISAPASVIYDHVQITSSHLILKKDDLIMHLTEFKFMYLLNSA